MNEEAVRGKGAGPAATSAQGALDVLAEEHRELKRRFDTLLDALERGVDAATRAQRLRELGRMLLSHTRAEEEVFFARMYRQPDLRATTERCLDEHTELEALLGHLSTMDGDDEAWRDLVWTLESSFELHAEQEEKEVYPQAVAEIGEAEVDALLARYQSCRARWERLIDVEGGGREGRAGAPL